MRAEFMTMCIENAVEVDAEKRCPGKSLESLLHDKVSFQQDVKENSLPLCVLKELAMRVYVTHG